MYEIINMLKCLAYKKWALDHTQQLVVYKSLIRSCIEYAPPLFLMSDNNISQLKAVLYHELRIIFKSPIKTLPNYTKKEPINTRIKKLSKNYIKKAKNMKNELIMKLVDENVIENPTRTKLTLLEIIDK